MIMLKVKRRVYRDTDEFTARLEEAGSILFLHIELKTKPTTKFIKYLRKEFKIFQKKIKSAGYDYIYSYSATPSFYKLFPGYEDLGPMEWEDGQYRVLRWALN
jgi:hypothetical protein